MADPAWPALVAAVTTGSRGGWSAANLLAAAVTGLPAAADGDRTGNGLTEALVFRVAALTDPAPVQAPEPLPADLQPPDDADQLPPIDDPAAACTAVPADDLPGHPDAPFDPEYDTGPPAAAPSYVTPDPFTRTGQADVDEADYLLEQHFSATAAVGRDRLIELNTQAATFFTDRSPDSWVPGYLRQRLGTDLTADPPLSPGYAPGGWTALVDHLRSWGATEEELLAAGLAQRTRTGTVIDRFRDRLTFPVRDVEGVIRGFVALRNPTAPGDGRAAPKYVNTPGTDLYRKGDHLLGLYESRTALAAGAVPALVEGPLDAVALTLAGDGRTIGVATLGTALTDQQADLLSPYIHNGGPGLLVATDADDAGLRAAERMYWHLAARDNDPRRLSQPDGLDPAELLHRKGTAALRAAIEAAGNLADHLLGRIVATAYNDGPDGAHKALRDAALIIAASPPARWLDRIDRVTNALHVPPGTVHMAVLGSRPIVRSPSCSNSPMRPHLATLSTPESALQPTLPERATPVPPTTTTAHTGAGPPSP